MVLEANEIINGNIFLSDWVLTGITFLTTDLVFFIIASLRYGINVNSSYIAISLMFVSFSLTSLFLLRWKKKEDCIKNILIWLSIGAFPISIGKIVLSVHTGVWIYTFVECLLLAKILNDNDSKRRKFQFTELFLLICITLGVIGDAIMLVAGVLPILIMCFFYYFNNTGKRSKSLRLALVTLGGVILGLVFENLYLYIGGADKNSYLQNTKFKPIEGIWDSFLIYAKGLIELFDANFFGKPIFNFATIICAFRFLIVLYGLYIVIRTVFNFLKKKNDDNVSIFLSISFVLISLCYIFSGISVDWGTTRYFAYAPILFSVLIIRNIGKMSIYPLISKNFSFRLIALGISILLITTTINNVFVQNRLYTSVNDPYIELGTYLEEKNLKNGFSGYWDVAYVTTVLTENKQRIIAIHNNGITITPFYFFNKKEWYTNEFTNYIVIGNGYGGITEENALAFFGTPFERATVGNFVILIYERDISKDLYDLRI
jgi:hypothetical protein